MLVQYLPEFSKDIPHRDLHPGDHPDFDPASTGKDENPDTWREAEALMNTLEDHELTDPAIGAERLIYRLFHENSPRVYEAQMVEHRCNCSREKISAMLTNFKPEELDEVIVNNQIEVKCEFCSTMYRFDPEAFKKI